VKKILFCLIVALIVSGCASSRSVRQADGWQNHVVGCGGPLLNMGHCLEKAGDICGGYGYTILNKAGGELPASATAIPTGGGPDLPGSWSELTDFQERKLLIRCN